MAELMQLFLSWLALNLLKVIGPKAYRSQYVVLTPPFLRTQLVFNKKGRKLKSFATRDVVDVSVLHQIFLNEHYRLDILARADSIFRKYREISRAGTPLIIDCGANIGLSAAYFKEQFPAAKVIAVEPDPNNIRQARRNCAHGAVELVHAAVASEDGAGKLVDPGRGNWGLQVAADANGDVAFVSINTLLRDNPDAVPFIAKIDIEGFEKDVFSRNLEWLDRFFVVIVELHDWMLPGQCTSLPFLKAISSLDRDFVHIGQNVFSVANK